MTDPKPAPPPRVTPHKIHEVPGRTTSVGTPPAPAPSKSAMMQHAADHGLGVKLTGDGQVIALYRPCADGWFNRA